jgi:hypothetical protein
MTKISGLHALGPSIGENKLAGNCSPKLVENKRGTSTYQGAADTSNGTKYKGTTKQSDCSNCCILTFE